jgi:uncharacterized membrane protein SpoIIM required for sporulation
MKRIVIPVVLAIILVAVALTLVEGIELPGIILAGAVGLGIGAVLNNIFFKDNKQTDETETK